ncbi:MAG: hypothetical protein WCJ94_04035 [bacterium]
MNRQLNFNIWLNIKFLSRNYLIITVLGIMALSILNIFSSANAGGGALQGFIWLHSIVTIAAFLIAVMIVSNPIKDRTVKMIVTKPCSPEVWTASSYATVNLVSISLHLIILIFASLLFAFKPDVLGISFSSYIYMWLSSIVAVMIFSSLLLFLTYILPTGLALLAMIIISTLPLGRIVDYCFNYSGHVITNILYKILGTIFYVFYLIIPYFSMENIMKVGQGGYTDWSQLGVFFVYGLVTLGFYYLMSVYAIKRRNLI